MGGIVTRPLLELQKEKQRILELFEKNSDLEFDACCVSYDDTPVQILHTNDHVIKGSDILSVSVRLDTHEDLINRFLNFLLECKICRLLETSISGDVCYFMS